MSSFLNLRSTQPPVELKFAPFSMVETPTPKSEIIVLYFAAIYVPSHRYSRILALSLFFWAQGFANCATSLHTGVQRGEKIP